MKPLHPLLASLVKLLRLLALLWLVLVPDWGNAAAAPVMVVPITGAIGPARADFVVRSFEQARQEHAQLIVLQIDTPGGLDLSMRQIIQAILASPIPVASFIAPSGARAASAGTYILYASHIAAMAPGTNLGAATPVQLGFTGSPSEPPSKNASGAEGDTMERKQVNDAAAYIRGLAQMRGRNVAWGEHAVREAVSLSTDEALAQKVIDLTARDLPDLLGKLEGRSISSAGGTHVLHTAAAPVIRMAPDWRERFLATITDPSIALILMMVGMYGLFFEFMNPGFVLPGLAGTICLLLGLFAIQLLPISYAGLALLLLGIGCLIAEMFLPTFGTLGVGGIVAFCFGALMLIDTNEPGFGIPVSLILGLAAFTAGFVFFVSSLALRARRRPVVSGREALVGSQGVLLDDLTEAPLEGWALIRGEQWRVRSAVPLDHGQAVCVTGWEGLTLLVAPFEQKPESRQGNSP